MDSANVAVGGGDIDIGCGNAFGGAAEDEGADDTVEKENNISGARAGFGYTVSQSASQSGSTSWKGRVRAPAAQVLNGPCVGVAVVVVVQEMPFSSKNEFKGWFKDYAQKVRQAMKADGVAQEEIKK